MVVNPRFTCWNFNAVCCSFSDINRESVRSPLNIWTPTQRMRRRYRGRGVVRSKCLQEVIEPLSTGPKQVAEDGETGVVRPQAMGYDDDDDAPKRNKLA